LWVIRDRDEPSSKPHHVGPKAEAKHDSIAFTKGDEPGLRLKKNAESLAL
jgi:hypothetical protein